MGLTISDYKQRQAFVNADPSYQELEQAAQAATETRTNIDHKRIQTLWKIRRLLVIRDIAINHTHQLEDADVDASEALKTFTGEDSDDWHDTLLSGCEELTEVLYELCSKIGALNYEYSNAEKARKQAWEVSGAKADELRKIWDLMQTKTEDSTDV